jgi:hypothetical protein
MAFLVVLHASFTLSTTVIPLVACFDLRIRTAKFVHILLDVGIPTDHEVFHGTFSPRKRFSKVAEDASPEIPALLLVANDRLLSYC